MLWLLKLSKAINAQTDNAKLFLPWGATNHSSYSQKACHCVSNIPRVLELQGKMNFGCLARSNPLPYGCDVSVTLWHEISSTERCKTLCCLQGENSAAHSRMNEKGGAEYGALTQVTRKRWRQLQDTSNALWHAFTCNWKPRNITNVLLFERRFPLLKDCCQKMWLFPPLLYFIAKSHYWENSSCALPSPVPKGPGAGFFHHEE